MLFLSTPSARRATESGTSLDKASPISIHALREEGDLRFAVTAKRQKDFYPRPPRGGRRQRGGKCGQKVTFLSTPSARRATTASQLPQNCQAISIHALREEGDAQLSGNNREGMQFLSTPSARRATSVALPPLAYIQDFYPRPPRGGRPDCCNAGMHACEFLSTPSARRATPSSDTLYRSG